MCPWMGDQTDRIVDAIQRSFDENNAGDEQSLLFMV